MTRVRIPAGASIKMDQQIKTLEKLNEIGYNQFSRLESISLEFEYGELINESSNKLLNEMLAERNNGLSESAGMFWYGAGFLTMGAIPELIQNLVPNTPYFPSTPIIVFGALLLTASPIAVKLTKEKYYKLFCKIRKNINESYNLPSYRDYPMLLENNNRK